MQGPPYAFGRRRNYGDRLATARPIPITLARDPSAPSAVTKRGWEGEIQSPFAAGIEPATAADATEHEGGGCEAPELIAAANAALH
jgi:hypothetical protein